MKLNADTLLKGVYYGFIIGFSFVLLSTMTSNMFANEAYGLAWITAGFTTFGLMLGGSIPRIWKKYKE